MEVIQMEEAQTLVEESDMIQVQEPVENNDPFNMDFGNLDSGVDMGLDMNMDIGLELNF